VRITERGDSVWLVGEEALEEVYEDAWRLFVGD
jgi:hypothetical protein